MVTFFNTIKQGEQTRIYDQILRKRKQNGNLKTKIVIPFVFYLKFEMDRTEQKLKLKK